MAREQTDESVLRHAGRGGNILRVQCGRNTDAEDVCRQSRRSAGLHGRIHGGRKQNLVRTANGLGNGQCNTDDLLCVRRKRVGRRNEVQRRTVLVSEEYAGRRGADTEFVWQSRGNLHLRRR